MQPQQQVVLFDLSGHGDSGRRRSYSYDDWATEITTVIEHACEGPVSLVCHSMSGRLGVLAAAHHPELVDSLVLVDAIIPTHEHESVPHNHPLKVYPDRATALARFRLSPASAPTDSDVLSALAARSIHEVPGGWSWKFDPQVFDAAGVEDVNPSLSAVTCPVSSVLGEISPVTDPSMFQKLETALGRKLAATVVVPGADHHFMVDMPAVAAQVLDQLPPPVRKQRPFYTPTALTSTESPTAHSHERTEP